MRLPLPLPAAVSTAAAPFDEPPAEEEDPPPRGLPPPTWLPNGAPATSSKGAARLRRAESLRAPLRASPSKTRGRPAAACCAGSVEADGNDEVAAHISSLPRRSSRRRALSWRLSASRMARVRGVSPSPPPWPATSLSSWARITPSRLASFSSSRNDAERAEARSRAASSSRASASSARASAWMQRASESVVAPVASGRAAPLRTSWLSSARQHSARCGALRVCAKA